MALKVFDAAVPHLFPSLGPALMISMGYIDLGKWVAAVEGGARFGFNFVSLVLFFNSAAILCQYLATCIGTATGKNLAEICSEEYSKSTCILLGVQAEISIITSELTTVLGIAHGLSLLFGVEMLPCIFLATVCTVPLHLLVLWNNIKSELLYISIAGIALVFFVSGVLISQPELPLAMDGVFPRLNGENAYSLMALLGANIMAHNFYIHSSVVQKQRRQPNTAMGTLFHDHFFAILSIFSGIFLVNYVLMNSAAAIFSNVDVVLNFQDVNLLMDQIFRSPIAPVAFFLVLFFSSQITALNWNIGGKVILTNFFRIKLPVWVHHVLVKALAIIPALYYAWIGGAEGIYQLLIFCQIILAMFVPSSVIPLFRVVSSTFLMGAFKIPWYVEIFSLFVFLGVLAANTIFVMDILFGNSSWISNLQEGMGSSTLVPHAVLFLIACTSFGLTLYLTVTPLKSASERPDPQSFASNIDWNNLELLGVREFDDLHKIKYDVDQHSSALESDTLEKPIESHNDESTLDANIDPAETVMDSDHDSQQSVHNSGLTSICSSPAHHVEKSKSLVDAEAEEILGRVSVCSFSDSVTSQKIEPKDPIIKDVEVSMDSCSDKDNNNDDDNGNNKEEFASHSEDSSRGILPTPSFETTGLSTSPTEKISDKSNSLSTLSGLGRAARRQLSAILDEFWGHLFDLHGKLTYEASTRRVDVLLGLDLKIAGSSLKADTARDEFVKGYPADLDRGLISQKNLRDFSSPRYKINTDLESAFGTQVGSRPNSHNMQVMDAHAENSFTNNQRHAMHSSYSSDNGDYQPATIHGCQISSYLRGVGSGRTPYSSNDSLGLPLTSSATSFIANPRDPVMYSRAQSALNSFGTSSFLDNPALSRISRLQVERPCYMPSFVETGENVVSSSYEKKYHSSPDISALIASIRNSSLSYGNVQHAQWGGPTSTQPSAGRMAYEQSQSLNCFSRTGVSLAFNELSPPKLHTDVFSSYLSLNPDTKSLWSRQPFEQLFGMHGNDQAMREDTGFDRRASVAPRETSSTESETNILQYLIYCIRKLLKLEGSDWLFRQNGGVDEELIDRVAAAEKFLHEAESSGMNQVNMLDQPVLERKNGTIQRNEGEFAHLLPITNCGDGCIWRAALVVSFGVWCIRRILELSVVESRPELWGKYTYVLNRLQGILEPAFSKPRHPLVSCSCLKLQATNTSNSKASMQNGLVSASGKTSKGSVTTAPMILEMIKDVEAAVSGRKGRTGTAAGDVAFPKGKENLVSVLKRYKRRLSNKPPATNESGCLSRRIPSPASPLL